MAQLEKVNQKNDNKDLIIFELSGEFKSHSQGITSIGISKNKPNTIITGSNDGTAVIWDLTQTLKIHNNNNTKSNHNICHTLINGQIIKIMQCHKYPITSVAIDDNATYAITGSHDTSIKLWNLSTFSLQRLFSAHTQEILSVSLSTDAKTTYSASKDKTVIIWNTMGQIIHTINHNTVITNIIISPNNKYLIIACIGLIQIYNLYTDQFNSKQIHPTFKLMAHKTAIYTLAISPDSTCIACGDERGNIKLYQTHNGQLICEFKVNGKINDICFAVGRYWLCCAVTHYILIWDLMNKSKICRLNICSNSMINGMNEGITNTKLIINCITFPYGNTIFIGCNDGILRTSSVVHENRNEESDEKIAAKHSNVKLQSELKTERMKNKESLQKIEEMTLQIKRLEMNHKNNKLEKQLAHKNKQYENLKAEFINLSNKHQQMINIVNYKLWSFDNIIDWICTLDNGKYEIYHRILHKRMKEENVRGIHLGNMNKTDLHRFGITDFEHKKVVIGYIKALSKTKTVKNKSKQ